MFKQKIHILYILLFLLVGCKSKEDVCFTKMPSSKTKIEFKNQITSSPELNILNYLYFYNGAGIAAGDFNNDGKIDLYFTSNQNEDKLYLNKGDFIFEDVTKLAKIDNTTGWTTGVTHVDINNDGLLDLYICKVNNQQNLKGRNLLYVNQGINDSGIPTFKEEANTYGIGFSGFSTKAAFFDYDLDGDLDMFLLNHSSSPNRTYGKGSKRKSIDAFSGDRLYRNDNGFFADASVEAGIYQGNIGYGLGLSISDINNDTYPDIYIGNDFFENDYLYVNQKNGTFKEIISQDNQHLGHTSHFSMGNDIADINNDGLTDIISLDMLPKNLQTYKTSGLEYGYPIYQQYLKNGYAPQYMQNALHLNLGDLQFSEVASLSGVSATEWSWGALLADFDNDGLKDLFISNGIKGATNDMDFINFIANDKIQQKISQGITKKEMAFIDEIPEKKVPNFAFKNINGLQFKDVSNKWFKVEPSFSNGSVYADLDNDGDLDIIVNNVNEKAFVYRNNSDKNIGSKALRINLKGSEKNKFGVGAKLTAYIKGEKLVTENYPARSYLSSVSNKLHIGIGKDSIIDSLIIAWPNKHIQVLTKVSTHKEITLNIKDANPNRYFNHKTKDSMLFKQTTFLGLDFAHKDNNSIEFTRDPLVPFANTNEGPEISVADVNNDELDDIFISGGKGQASALYYQKKDGSFEQMQKKLFENNALNEDISQTFFDANNDGFIDLLVVSGGNEFKSSDKLYPRLYLNYNGVFTLDSIQFKNIEVNASKIKVVDFDNDNDMDVVIVSDQLPQQFGKTPKQFLFQNNGEGSFKDVTTIYAPEFRTIGNVNDIVFVDLNKDGYKDMIAVGHWMPISIFINENKILRLQNNKTLKNSNGWWNSVKATDFDNDGDIDIIAGNWGLNSKFSASASKPISLYSADFDDNLSIEPLVTYFYNNKETPFASKDELTKQMPYLNKKFLSYDAFAKATVDELFSVEKLNSAYKKNAYQLASCYYVNNGKNEFERKELPFIAQNSTIQDMIVEDFDNDGFKDILAVGNNYEISTQLGRMDASHGIFLQNDKASGFRWPKKWKANIAGPARTINKIVIASKEYYVITINNSKPIFLSKK